MKKTFLFIFSLLLVVVLSATVYASNSYDVAELKLSVDAPDGWLVVSQDTAQNKEAVEFYGIPSETLVDFLKQRMIYINFVNNDSIEEIFITMSENENSQSIISINALSKKQLNDIAKEMMKTDMDDVRDAAERVSLETIDAENVEWEDYEIYYHDQAVFLKFYLTKTLQGSSLPAIQYTTIQNGQCINVVIQSYTDSISNALELEGQAFVDSIVFSELQEGNAPKDIYSITKTIVMFTCIIFITLALVFYSINKKKNGEPPVPPYTSSNNYNGNLE